MLAHVVIDYMSSGYSAPFTIEELFKRVAGIKSIEGVELG